MDVMETMSAMGAVDAMLRMSASGSLLILAVILLRAALIYRLPKRTFSFLWTVCALRLVIPVFPACRLSFEALWRAAVARPGSWGTAKDVPGFVWPSGDWMTDWAEAGAFSGSELTGAAGWTAVGSAGRAAWIQGLWLVGTLVFVAWFAVVYLRYRRRFAASLPLEADGIGPVGTPSCGWRFRRTFRSVRLRQSDRIDGPLSFGLVRPVILFPAIMDWGDREAVNYVIAHEMAHIRRFDGLRKGAFAAALCVHWWNPLVWLMFFLANRDLELACDEAVIRSTEGDCRADYAMALIRLEGRRSACTALYSHFNRNAMEERIGAIMKTKRISRAVVTAAVCLALGLTVVFATSAPGETMEEEGNGGDLQVLSSSVSKELLWPGEGCNQVTMTFGERVHPVTGETMVTDHITMGDSKGEAEGSAVRAAEAGKVTEAGFDGELGNYLVIDHGDGLVTKYTHCRELLAEPGDRVRRGDTIAILGSTGMATGPCLGFYVYEDGEARDPETYF